VGRDIPEIPEPGLRAINEIPRRSCSSHHPQSQEHTKKRRQPQRAVAWLAFGLSHPALAADCAGSSLRAFVVSLLRAPREHARSSELTALAAFISRIPQDLGFPITPTHARPHPLPQQHAKRYQRSAVRAPRTASSGSYSNPKTRALEAAGPAKQKTAARRGKRIDTPQPSVEASAGECWRILPLCREPTKSAIGSSLDVSTHRGVECRKGREL